MKSAGNKFHTKVGSLFTSSCTSQDGAMTRAVLVNVVFGGAEAAVPSDVILQLVTLQQCDLILVGSKPGRRRRQTRISLLETEEMGSAHIGQSF